MDPASMPAAPLIYYNGVNMKQELQDRIFNRFEQMFRKKDLDMSQTCMCWGIDCGNGWFDLIWELCEKIEPLVDKEFAVEQVKEKFGTLRFYTNAATREVHDIISGYERKSENICEECGKPSKVIKKNGWLYNR